jgi:hypothetical protein
MGDELLPMLQCASAAIATIVQIRLFLGRGRSAENRVAMWKTPKPLDDVTMMFRVTQVRLPHSARQLNGSFLSARFSE